MKILLVFFFFCLVVSSNLAFGIAQNLENEKIKIAKFYDKGLDEIKKSGTDLLENEANETSEDVDSQENSSILVTGIISFSDGATAENHAVKVFTSGLGGNQQVGSAVTDSSGAYSIDFDSDSPATVVVKVYFNGKQVGSSSPAYNVTESIVVDVTVSSTKNETKKKSKAKKAIDVLY